MFSELIFKLLKYAKADQLPPPRFTRWLMIVACALTIVLTLACVGIEFRAHQVFLALIFLLRDLLVFGLIFHVYVWLLLTVIYNPIRAVLSMAVTVRDALESWRAR